MNFVEMLPVLIPAAVTAVSAVSGLIYAQVEKKKQANARKEAEAKSFYLHTAQTLVLSAERMQLTGMQKKEYVMTRLENECIRAGVKVDYMQMSMAVERAVLVMNDHRELNRPVSELLEEAEAKAQEAIDESLAIDLATAKVTKESTETLAKEALEAAKQLFQKKNN